MTGRTSAKTRKRRKRGDKSAVANVATPERTDNDAEATPDAVRDGFTLDFISGTKEVKETPKELVRQRIARALFHEYGISVEDMAADFPVLVGGRRRRVDIAIFAAGETHEPEHIQRVVVCRPEPKQTTEEFESLNRRLRRYASKQVFGCDFDPSLVDPAPRLGARQRESTG